ncbi:unnamed protein product [Tuber melanosporum]|uniref:(Perigord truffle) hypothetical protein n=1 Tax=Tuber melanosporum (strain Mel28) TaxID=656061 RepID=D5G529_TUBMM|nr:uncharacterized protein GSTUM_00000287001 [Tuber melanosporum]CAZ79660.1 unnamed protein product [Tuber melanosporum]
MTSRWKRKEVQDHSASKPASPPIPHQKRNPPFPWRILHSFPKRHNLVYAVRKEVNKFSVAM